MMDNNLKFRWMHLLLISIIAVAFSMGLMFSYINAESEDDSGKGDTPAFEENSDGTLTLVKWYPEDVTDIDLTDEEVPGTDGRAITAIKAGAFSDCTQLESLYLSDSIRSLDEAFLSGSSVTVLSLMNLPKGKHILDGSSVETVYWADETELLPGDFLYSPVKPEEEWYDEYENPLDPVDPARHILKHFTIESSIREIGADAFAFCDSLEEVEGLSAVSIIGNRAFGFCSALTDVTLNADRIEESAFQSAGVTTLEISERDNPVVIGDYAFSNCGSLTDVQFPMHVQSIGKGAFSYCWSLKLDHLPDADIGEEAFYFASETTSVVMDTDPDKTGPTSIGKSAFGYCSGLTSFVLSDNVRSLGESAFQSCRELNSINLDKVQLIGNNAFDSTGFTGTLRVPTADVGKNAFSSCKNITRVEFFKQPGSPSSWSVSEGEFYGCSALTEVVFADGLTGIGKSAFAGSGLTGFTMPEGNIEIGEMAFSACKNLTSFDYSVCSPSIGDKVFAGCTNLKTVIMPQSIRSMGAEVFSNCTSLSSVQFPASVTGIKELPARTFYRCFALTAVSLPQGLTSIGQEAFFDCVELKTVTLPDSMRIIGTRAFALCLKLKNVDLGKGVQKLGESAFECCQNNLVTIAIPASVTEIGNFCFKDCEKLTELQFADETSVRKYGAGFVYATGVGIFTMYPGVTYESAEYVPFTGSYKKPKGVLGPLSGAGIEDVVVKDGVKTIPDNFFSNAEMNGKMLDVYIYGPGVSIGSNAFKNAGTMSFCINIYNGLPSSIASDAFAIDDPENTLSGLAINYTQGATDWGDLPNHYYGREMRWGVSANKTEGDIEYMMDGTTLIVYHRGADTVDMPDFTDDVSNTEMLPPWYDDLGSAKRLEIVGRIRTIGAYAFINGPNVKDVTISKYVREIHSKALLINMNVLQFKGSCPEFAEEVFQGCFTCYIPGDDSSWRHVRSIDAKFGQKDEYNYGATQIFWEVDPVIRLMEDNNSVRNSIKVYGDSYYTDYLDRLVSKCDKKELSGLQKVAYSKDDRGVCFGLASTMMLHKDGLLNKVFDNDTSYWYLCDDPDYGNTVKYFQLLQEVPSVFHPEVRTIKDQSFLRKKTRIEVDYNEFMEEFIHTIIESQQSRRTCLFKYNYSAPNGKKSAHVAVCCGFEFGELDENAGKEYAIRFYDVNLNEAGGLPYKYFYMFIGEDFSWFSMKDANMTLNGTDLKDIWKVMEVYTIENFSSGIMLLPDGSKSRAYSSLSAMSVDNADSNQIGDQSNQVSIVVPAYEAYTVSNASGQSLTNDATETTGDLPVSEATMITDDEPKFILDTDESDYFEVSGINGEFSFTAEVNGLSYIAETTGAERVRISKDKGVEVSGNGLVEYSVAVTELNNDKAFTMAEGSSQGGMSFTVENGMFLLTGDSGLSNVSVLTDRSGSVSERELIAGGNKIEFGLNENNEIKTKEELDDDNPVSDTETSRPVIKVAGIRLSGISNKVAAGKSIQLSAVLIPSNADNRHIIWKSSNTKVATVSQSGKVNVRKKTGGKSVTITAVAADGSGASASYQIKSMKGAVKKIAISGAKKTVKAGKTMKLKAKVKAGKGANKKVMWTSSNPEFAKVDSKGKVTLLPAGKGKTVIITASSTDGTNKKKKVRVKIK